MTDSGWEHYPKRLRNYDPLRDDGGSYDDRLGKHSKRLFTEKGSMSVDVLDVNRDEFFADDTKPETFKNSESFEELLTASPSSRESRFYYLKPAAPHAISRSRIHIPQETLRKILTVHQVMPGFVDFLLAFGRKHNSTDSGYGGCKRKIAYAAPTGGKQRNLDYYEICYNIKFVEENHRENGDPWSVRQTCVYQKFEYSKKSNTWILVQPSEQVQNRLLEVFKARTTEDIENSVHNPLEIHLVFLSAAAENWRWYYNHLEETLVEMTHGGVNSTVGRKPTMDAKASDPNLRIPKLDGSVDFEVEFKHVQDLQKFEEKVQDLLLALETNRDTIKTLQKHNNQLQKCGLELEDHHFATVEDSLDTYLVELSIHKRNVEALLQRIRGRSRLLYNVLDYRNAEIAHHHSERGVSLTALGRQDSDLMMTMTKRTTREAVAVKIVTFVTLFYLPATFVATFMSANCIKFVEETVNGRVATHIAVSKEMVLFAAITAPLMCITLGVWYFWTRQEGRRVKEELREKPNPYLE